MKTNSAKIQRNESSTPTLLSKYNGRKLLLCVLLLSVYLPVNFKFRNFNINIYDGVFTMIFLVFIAQILVSRRFKLKIFDEWILFPIIGLIIYSLFQLFFVRSQFRIVVESLQLLVAILLIFILSGNNFVKLSDSDLSKILRILFYFSLIGAINSIGYSVIIGKRFVGVWRVWFVFGSLSYGFFYSFYHLMFYKKKMYYIFLAVFIVAVVLSRTRGLWISIPLSIGFISLTHKEVRKKILRYSFAFLILFTIFVSVIKLPPNITSKFYSIFTGTQGFWERPERWLTNLRIFQDYPLGVGLGNSRYFALDYMLPSYIGYDIYKKKIGQEVTGPTYGGHSDWFTLLAETGLVGVVLYACFWLLIMKNLIFRKIYSTEALVLATFLISIFAGTFISGYILEGRGLEIIFVYYIFMRIMVQKSNLKSYCR